MPRATDTSRKPTLHPSLCYGHLSCATTNFDTLVVHMNHWHVCQAATIPPIQALTIQHIYPDLSQNRISVHADVVTICDVLAGVEQLMTVDLDHGTSNDPYGSTAQANRRRGTERPPCQREVNYLDHMRCLYGEAGLTKSESGEDVWEFRLFGQQVNPELFLYAYLPTTLFSILMK